MKDLSKDERMSLMKFVCSFAWADLRIADTERKFVQRLVRKLKLGKDEKAQVEQWLELPPRADELDPEQIAPSHKALFLTTAREMIEADGQIAAEEVENFELLEELLT